MPWPAEKLPASDGGFSAMEFVKLSGLLLVREILWVDERWKVEFRF